MAFPALLPLHHSAMVEGSDKEGLGRSPALEIRKPVFYHWLWHPVAARTWAEQPARTPVTLPTLLHCRDLMTSCFLCWPLGFLKAMAMTLPHSLQKLQVLTILADPSWPPSHPFSTLLWA